MVPYADGQVSVPSRVSPVVAATALAAAILAVPLVLAPLGFVVLVGAAAVVAGVIARPRLATYVLLPVTLLTGGVERGVVAPLLRPSEVLLVLVGGALLLRAVMRMTTGKRPQHTITRVELALVLLCITGSVLPLLMMVARSRPIELEDLLYASTFWKYLALYVIVRVTIRTEQQTATCLWLVMGAAAVVAVLGVLQSLELFGLPRLLARFYTPEGELDSLAQNRGSSTLGSSLAVGDVMAFSLAIAAGWLLRGGAHRRLLAAAAVVFVFGALAAGQFSSVIALTVAAVAVGFITRRLHRLVLAGAPVALAAAVALEPVIRRRLSGFESSAGVPRSWLGRLENLRRFFWPELSSDYNYLLGVRPAARVRAPENWRDWVYIESGHTWLLWTGGIPFVVAFAVFAWLSLTRTARLARARTGAIGVAATAAFAALAVQVVLLTLDVHLVLRGAGDLTFALLALAFTAPPADAAEPPTDVGASVRAPALIS